ncbi:hypothetical protein RUND412_007368 [Rhizina undulata]
MDSAVLVDILDTLPSWTVRLETFSRKFADNKPQAPAAVDPDGPQPTTIVGTKPLRPTSPTSAADLKRLERAPNAGKHMNKLDSTNPAPPKAKFSRINGPHVYYDGEAQQALYECWTTLNAKRGGLRKEMMAIRRKKVMSFPKAGYSYPEDDEEEDDEEEQESEKETEEQRKAREAEECRKAEEERKRAESEKKRAEILEYIDTCLDKASKACENAAFLWLKGEACSGHVTFITMRMQEAMDRIRKETKKEKPELEDEGIGADSEVEVSVEVKMMEAPPSPAPLLQEHAPTIIGVMD